MSAPRDWQDFPPSPEVDITFDECGCAKCGARIGALERIFLIATEPASKRPSVRLVYCPSCADQFLLARRASIIAANRETSRAG